MGFRRGTDKELICLLIYVKFEHGNTFAKPEHELRSSKIMLNKKEEKQESTITVEKHEIRIWGLLITYWEVLDLPKTTNFKTRVLGNSLEATNCAVSFRQSRLLQLKQPLASFFDTSPIELVQILHIWHSWRHHTMTLSNLTVIT